jgi:hypothetical protein
MSISAPPGQPSIGETVGSSFRDGGAIAKANIVPAAVFIVLGTVACVTLALSGALKAGAVPPAWFAPLITLADLAAIVTGYYAIAGAVRTIHPEYRMTFGQFIGMFGYSLLVGLLTMIAAMFFVIPGYWVGMKLLLTPYTYVVTNGAPDALKTTWNMTTGYYWQTFGLVLLLGICAGAIASVAYFIALFIGGLAPITSIVLAPIVLGIVVWLMHVHALAYVRWTDGLLPRANIPQAVPVPA